MKMLSRRDLLKTSLLAPAAVATQGMGIAPTSVMPSNMDSFQIRGITTWQRGGDPNLGGAPYDPGAAFRIAVEDYKQDVQK
jgi:hypothetical protein